MKNEKLLRSWRLIKQKASEPLTLLFAATGLIILFAAIVIVILFPSKRPVTIAPTDRHFLVNEPQGQAQPDALAPCLGNGVYSIHEGKVYYQFINHYCGQVEGDADAASFEVLDYGFARDKDKGFYGGQAVEIRNAYGKPPVQTDGKTFEALADGYARDKNHVYFFNETNFHRMVIDGADPTTFKVLTTWFGSDAHSGFYGWSAIPQSDGQTLEIVDVRPIGQGRIIGFTKDVSRVFISSYDKSTVITGADPKTFETYKNLNDISGRLFSRDSEHVFWGTDVISKADPDSFQLVETTGTLGMCAPFFKDISHVFAGTGIIEGADPATFRYIGQVVGTPVLYSVSCLAADKNNVYVDSTKIPNLDPQSVQTLGIYLKDKRAVYLYTTELKGADPKTFELIDEGSVSAKDKNSVYECGQVVMPNQTGFKFLGDYYGRIGSSVYHLGQVIPGADGSSFSPMGGSEILSCESSSGGYAKDKNHVYFAGKLIQGADPQTFKLSFELGIAQDKNGEYRLGVKVPNDFIKCSTETADLPGGLAGWQSKLPALGSDTSTASFEFCIMPNQDKLIGYKPDPTVEAKTINWFDPKNQLIETMKLDCSNLGTVLPQSIRALNGSTVTLQCLAQDACASRVFYELNLDDWKSSSSSTLRKTDESYDCGYRG
ncbi:hypothetical protein EXS71_01630 [Candidatus Uhrbacteria bacterium]|nr:hypothetical protein [Candidatus Uhrbacteria bacterium]